VIRIVAVVSLLCLLVLVLYLPSAHPPERFLAQLRIEHQAMAAFWGEAPALRILSRALGLQDSARQATPVPSAAAALPSSALGGAVAHEMASVNQRLFDNAYFRSIDALVLLAAFRLSTLLECLPWLAAFALAVLADGCVVRLIKSKEFRFVVPVTLHPLVMPGIPIAISVLLSRAVASFHRRA
jgi:hypothetical protein